ncbi:LamG domain-containing protein [Methyloterricola oryzae]|uniref:LamG domain-containing protein n=1 Tax=Methyloterricola oryzae TaxID=1495050 RepID=UPI0005EBD9CE|nr:LamG domain-containing protein [Methyloterricola oryzae]
MAAKDQPILSELSGAPLGDVIRAVAVAVADGQFQLDQASMRAAEFMSGHVLRRDETGQPLAHADPPTFDTLVEFGYRYDENGDAHPNRLSLMELGFVPTFYQFVDTVIDVKLTLRLQRQSIEADAVSEVWNSPDQPRSEIGGRAPGSRSKTLITATTVDARYASSYNFRADMTSRVSTKLVPIPPPAALEQRIFQQLERQTANEAIRQRVQGLRESRSLKKCPLTTERLEGGYCEGPKNFLPPTHLPHGFTVEAWVAPDAGSGPKVDGYVDAGLHSEILRKGWLMGLFDGKFGFALVTEGTPTETRVVAADEPISPGVWKHLAGVYDGSVLRFYLNGRLCDGSRLAKGPILYSTKAVLTIGALRTDGHLQPVAARIDEVRVWDRPRSASEIKRDMEFRLNGNEPGLVAYWSRDKGFLKPVS